jgi:beta-lactamase class D
VSRLWLPLACAVVGCAPKAAPAERAVARPEAPRSGEPESCFLLYQTGVGEVVRSPSAACRTRVTPASTFKIPHALAALDAGVVAGADASFAYDGAPADSPLWQRDHTLASAMRYSVVWYFQRLASLLGRAREQDYLARFHYGNEDASSGLTSFWLGGSLLVSPEEQERFLVALYAGELPVSEEAQRVVRRILIQPRGVVTNATGDHPFLGPWPPGTVVSAKTGMGPGVRWLVGRVQRETKSWVFVSAVLGESSALAAVELASRELRAAHVL